jgi:hypothetical protein
MVNEPIIFIGVKNPSYIPAINLSMQIIDQYFNEHEFYFTYYNRDTAGISPSLWKHMMEYFGVKTLLDVGCGRGVSTSWFHLQGVKATCVEGSKDARSKNLLITLISEDGKNPSAVDERYIEHDYTRGPWWPSETV